MTAILALIKGNPVTTILLVLIAGFGLTTYIEHLKVDDYEAKYREAAQNVKLTTAANKTAQTTITTLEAELATWKANADNATAQEAAQATALAAQLKDLADARSKLGTQEKSDNALPSCQQFEARDLAVLCPAHAAAARVRSAASGLPGPNGPGTGARAPADQPRPHSRLPAGSVLTVGRPPLGVRSTLALGGG
jgi:hypothetical protein